MHGDSIEGSDLPIFRSYTRSRLTWPSLLRFSADVDVIAPFIVEFAKVLMTFLLAKTWCFQNYEREIMPTGR